jgi:hypothetical protein
MLMAHRPFGRGFLGQRAAHHAAGPWLGQSLGAQDRFLDAPADGERALNAALRAALATAGSGW